MAKNDSFFQIEFWRSAKGDRTPDKYLAYWVPPGKKTYVYATTNPEFRGEAPSEALLKSLSEIIPWPSYSRFWGTLDNQGWPKEVLAFWPMDADHEDPSYHVPGVDVLVSNSAVNSKLSHTIRQPDSYMATKAFWQMVQAGQLKELRPYLKRTKVRYGFLNKGGTWYRTMAVSPSNGKVLTLAEPKLWRLDPSFQFGKSSDHWSIDNVV